MAKAFNETDRIVSGILIVVGAFGHEAGRFVFLQLSDMRSPPSNEHKNSRHHHRCDFSVYEEQSLSAPSQGFDIVFTSWWGSVACLWSAMPASTVRR